MYLPVLLMNFKCEFLYTLIRPSSVMYKAAFPATSPIFMLPKNVMFPLTSKIAPET